MRLSIFFFKKEISTLGHTGYWEDIPQIFQVYMQLHIELIPLIIYFIIYFLNQILIELDG